MPTIVVTKGIFPLPRATAASGTQKSLEPVSPKPAAPVQTARAGVDCKGNFCWEHFGGDRFAETRAIAMQNRERVFREGFKFSLACVAAASKATETPGAPVHLNVNDRLDVMMSGGFTAHVNTIVLFPPVRIGIDYAATAEAWTIYCDGREKQILLPEICFNWSIRTPPPGQEACAEVVANVEPEDLVRWAIVSIGHLPSSLCWQVCDGNDCSAPLTPCDNCDWIGPLSQIPKGRTPFHTGKHTAHARVQKFRFPVNARDEYFAICVDRKGSGQSDGGVVEPSDWAGRLVYQVPQDRWPVWGTFQKASEVRQ